MQLMTDSSNQSTRDCVRNGREPDRLVESRLQNSLRSFRNSIVLFTSGLIRGIRPMIVRWLLILIACGANFANGDCFAAGGEVDYLKQIKPLLRERCFTCHGALKQQAGLRLDAVALMLKGGESGAVITRGDADRSSLWQRVSAKDPDERMPPAEEGDRLSPAQLKLIRDWITNGAVAPEDEQPEADPREHWAFRTVSRPPVPSVKNAAWVCNPIDAFIARQHDQHGLVPQPVAPRAILLRRLHLDLTGIPPTADEIAAFENDNSPQWYEKTVKRLLDNPRHGERWARHWMDIWRYSDWWGFGEQLRRSQKHIWHWRDWIVESLNHDASYAEMIRLMLAADELHPNDLGKLRATGFLARNYWLFNRNQWMEETVEHVSKGLLGLTMNCAKCHDHKYDPLEQTDYYKMRAFFEPYHVRLDVVPGQTDLAQDGIPVVYDGWLDRPTYRFIRGQEKHADMSTVIAAGVPKVFTFAELKIEPISLPAAAWKPERRSWIAESQLAAARKTVAAAEAAVRKARETLATDTKQGTGDGKVTLSEMTLQVVDADLDLAKTQLTSLERRIEAMRAAWALDDNTPEDNKAALQKSEREKTAAAIRSERQVAVAAAKKDLAAAKRDLLGAKDAKQKAATEKKLKTAQATLDKATATANADVKPTDKYTRFVGARWTPTRFLSSGKDDPQVEFAPNSTGRRTALANWIANRRNPLTARVAVNHLWMRHMGAPLVSTVFDFGRNGARPAHPELVDWLAAELMDNDWSMKHVHRLIVNSAAYRMSSSATGGETNLAKDPDNRFWWRRVPIRLESQVVRDSIVAHTGRLDPAMGGPPVPLSQQTTSTRRSLYFFHSNNERNPFLTQFDEALVTECYRREQSIVPQQALALTNSQLVIDASQQIAQRLATGITNDDEFIRKAFQVLLAINPGPSEFATSKKALAAWQELSGGSKEKARANFVWALINHNDFVTVR